MASVFAIIRNQQDELLLLHRSAASSRPHHWCLPDGGIQRLEMPETAIVREVREEF